MIEITQHAFVPNHPDMMVYSPSGNYDVEDLIECYKAGDPSKSICAFQAQCVKYGDGIYSQVERSWRAT